MVEECSRGVEAALDLALEGYYSRFEAVLPDKKP